MERYAGAARLLGPALLAAAIQLVGTAGAATHQLNARPLDAVAVALLLAGPVALLARYRFAVPTLVVTSVLLLGYLAGGYPFGPVVVSFVFALVSAVCLGHSRPAWVLAGLTYLGLIAVTWTRSGP
ncbi:MAG: hypothetical protein QOG57_4949, partial [Pseudonocardiales bacterium]|nr:hypothetical protein [Pseudonocardiales bacterium]